MIEKKRWGKTWGREFSRLGDRRSCGGADALGFELGLQRTLTFYLWPFEMLSHALAALLFSADQL